MIFSMLLYSRYKLILYYTTYIVKNLIVIKAKKQKKNPDTLNIIIP